MARGVGCSPPPRSPSGCHCVHTRTTRGCDVADAHLAHAPRRCTAPLAPPTCVRSALQASSPSPYLFCHESPLLQSYFLQRRVCLGHCRGSRLAVSGYPVSSPIVRARAHSGVIWRGVWSERCLLSVFGDSPAPKVFEGRKGRAITI